MAGVGGDILYDQGKRVGRVGGSPGEGECPEAVVEAARVHELGGVDPGQGDPRQPPGHRVLRRPVHQDDQRIVVQRQDFRPEGVASQVEHRRDAGRSGDGRKLVDVRPIVGDAGRHQRGQEAGEGELAGWTRHRHLPGGHLKDRPAAIPTATAIREGRTLYSNVRSGSISVSKLSMAITLSRATPETEPTGLRRMS